MIVEKYVSSLRNSSHVTMSKNKLIFFLTHKNQNSKKAFLYGSLHGGGLVCIVEAWSAYWRLGLPSKSGRLKFAQQRLIAPGGSIPLCTRQLHPYCTLYCICGKYCLCPAQMYALFCYCIKDQSPKLKSGYRYKNQF